MNRKSLLILIAIVIATSSFATDLITRDGTTYRNAQITGVDPDGIHVTHSNGVAKVRFEDLPEPLQKQYHYNAAKVAAYRKQVEDSLKAEEENRELQLRLTQEAAQRKVEEQRRIEQERIASEGREKAFKEAGRWVGIILGACVAIFLYFLPSIVGRHKTNIVAIFVFNLFLGWTFLGWVLALVWACTKDSAMDTLARERTAKRETQYLK